MFKTIPTFQSLGRILCILLLCLCFVIHPNLYAQKVTQNFRVYIQNELYRVKGLVDGMDIKISTSADQAIQFAINQIDESGGQISIQRGIYRLKNPILLKNKVWLKGSGRGTILRVEHGRDIKSALFCQELDGVMISDLTIQPVDRHSVPVGIIMDNCGDSQINNVFCIGFARYGIWLRNQSFLCKVKSCNLTDNVEAGIFCDNLGNTGRIGDYVPNMISNCIIYGGGTALDCQNTKSLNISDCLVFQALDNAFFIHDQSSGIVLTDCHTVQTIKDAVRIESSQSIRITNNTFYQQQGQGISLQNVTLGLVNSNHVIDSGIDKTVHTEKNAIRLEATSGLQISSNVIYNQVDQSELTDGIYEDSTCANNIFAHNIIDRFSKLGIASNGSGSIVDNNIQQPEPSLIQGKTGSQQSSFDTQQIENYIQNMFGN